MIKPMLFNTDMVRAILEGRKTVTRRAVKPQPQGDGSRPKPLTTRPGYWNSWGDDNVYRQPCQSSDILWVREAWARSMAGTFMYRADDKAILIDRWRQSIHMPREAARIFLRVTNVQVERLQDINGLHAKEEGCEGYVHINPLYGCPETVHNFRVLWDSTIKPKDLPTYGWEANPWVWVIEFERCNKPEGFA